MDFADRLAKTGYSRETMQPNKAPLGMPKELSAIK